MFFEFIVIRLKSTFVSRVCEFTAKAWKGRKVLKCRCNIFTIGGKNTVSHLCVSVSSICNFLAISSLKLVHARSTAYIESIRYRRFSSNKIARKYVNEIMSCTAKLVRESKLNCHSVLFS